MSERLTDQQVSWPTDADCARVQRESLAKAITRIAELEAERDELQSKLDSAHDPKSVGNIAWLAEQYKLRAEKAEAELHRIRESPGLTAEQRDLLDRMCRPEVLGKLGHDALAALLAACDSRAAALAERQDSLEAARHFIADLQQATGCRTVEDAREYAAALAERDAEIAELTSLLRWHCVIPVYDNPGGPPELCGYECLLCKVHDVQETHADDCPLSQARGGE